jgi:hypothetical protein
MPNVHRSSIVALTLLALAGCEGGTPPTGEVAPIREPLRVRMERRLGDGAAGYRGSSEPRDLEKLSGIQVRCGTLIDAIRFRYRDPAGNQRWGDWVGGPFGGPRAEFLMEPFEKLVLVEARTGAALDYIKFTTVGPSGNRTYDPLCAGTGGGPVSFETGFQGSERFEIHGFSAGYGGTTPDNSMSWIKLIAYLPLQTVGSVFEDEIHVGWGGNGGSFFNFSPQGDEVLAGVQGAVNNDDPNFPVVGALRALYRTRTTGTERWTSWAGDPNRNCTGGCVTFPEFRLMNGEFFTAIDGNASDNVWDLLFITNLGRTYGRIGSSVRGSDFQYVTRVHGGLKRRITGFSGMAGLRVDRIEVRDGYPDCGHLACISGGPLVASCDPCVAQICAADPSCCNSAWTSACVARVATSCGLNCNPN